MRRCAGGADELRMREGRPWKAPAAPPPAITSALLPPPAAAAAAAPSTAGGCVSAPRLPACLRACERALTGARGRGRGRGRGKGKSSSNERDVDPIAATETNRAGKNKTRIPRGGAQPRDPPGNEDECPPRPRRLLARSHDRGRISPHHRRTNDGTSVLDIGCPSGLGLGLGVGARAWGGAWACCVCLYCPVQMMMMRTVGLWLGLYLSPEREPPFPCRPGQARPGGGCNASLCSGRRRRRRRRLVQNEPGASGSSGIECEALSWGSRGGARWPIDRQMEGWLAPSSASS